MLEQTNASSTIVLRCKYKNIFVYLLIFFNLSDDKNKIKDAYFIAHTHNFVLVLCFKNGVLRLMSCSCCNKNYLLRLRQHNESYLLSVVSLNKLRNRN